MWQIKKGTCFFGYLLKVCFGILGRCKPLLFIHFSISRLMLGLCILTSLIIVSIPNTAFPEVVGKLQYQGRLKQDGADVTGKKSIVFNIYNAKEQGTLLWTSGVREISVDRGLFTYKMGANVFFDEELFATTPVYLELIVDNNVLTPREELAVTPYAIKAGKVDWEDIAGMPIGFSDGIDDGITYYTETDPLFTTHISSTILASQVTNWDNVYQIVTTSQTYWDIAYSWGDHSIEGYITHYTETDPFYTLSVSSRITDAGSYQVIRTTERIKLASAITYYAETDPLFTTHVSSTIIASQITNWENIYQVVTASQTYWDLAYGWGDHSTQGYITYYAETDPLYVLSVSSQIIDAGSYQVITDTERIKLVGAITYYAETDPLYVLSVSSQIIDAGSFQVITDTERVKLVGAITYYTETDPLYVLSVSSQIIDAGSFQVITDTERAKLVGAITYYTETDPQIGIIPTNNIPKWYSTELSTGTIYDVGGNVGIGKTAPSYKLEVDGSMRFTSGSLFFPDGSSMTTANSGSATAVSSSETVSITADADANQTGSIEFNINGSKIMIVTNDGNVGIGTTSPTQAFEVYGNIKSTANIYATGGDSIQWSAAYGWGDHSTLGYITYYSETDPLFTVSVSSLITDAGSFQVIRATERTKLDSAITYYTESDPQVGAINMSYVPKWDGTSLITGNIFDTGNYVGIGTTAPEARLHVMGDGSEYAMKITNGSILLDTGSEYLIVSDIRDKTNVTKLDNVIDKLIRISAVRYDEKSTIPSINGEGKYIGFVAQELENVYPELVHTDEVGHKSVAYNKLTPILVQGIRELKIRYDARIEEVDREYEKKIQILKSQNLEIKKRVQKLEKLILRLTQEGDNE